MGTKMPNLSTSTWDKDIAIRICWLYDTRKYRTIISSWQYLLKLHATPLELRQENSSWMALKNMSMRCLAYEKLNAKKHKTEQ